MTSSKMRNLYVAWLPVAVCCLATSLSATHALAATRSYDFQRTVLSNGLTVISLEDHSCPIVAVQVWYHVGSKDEDPMRQGFAHMFEHMMFRGTDRLGPEEHFEFIRRTGGDCNAYTAFDNTTYVNQVPANQLELALWLEAERMAFLKIDEQSFHKERAVVEEERRMGSLNSPYGTVPEKLLPVIFTKHPYQWTPIGQIPHLRAATIDELQAFWDKYYVPANATLVVVGDVAHADVRRLAEKYFGWIPKMPAPPRVRVIEPAQTEPRSVTIPEKKGPVPLVGLVYRGVPKGHPDEVPLGMLMAIVGEGQSSRLYRDLVKEQKIAQMAVAGTFSLEDDALVGAGAALMPWGNKQKVLAAVRGHFQRVRAELVTQRELDKVRNQLLSREVEQLLAVERKAGLLGECQAIEGDADKANERLGRIRAVTTDDLLRVAGTYLTPERETVAIVQPEIGGMIKSLLGVKDDVNEGAAPVPEPTGNRVAGRGGLRAELQRPAGFPTSPPTADLLAAVPKIPHEQTTLKNGLKVVVVPNHEVPFVTVTLGILNGAWTEEGSGAASMAAQMITKGSKDHTAAELAEELAFNAISLSGSASMDQGSVKAWCVSDQLEPATRFLAEVVRTPKFPQTELEILRQQVLMSLMIESKTPEYVADREFRRRLFGEHPYSRTAVGEPADVEALTADELRKWWTTFVRPDSAVLYIAGDVAPEAGFGIARKYLEDWRVEGERPSPKAPTAPLAAATHIYLVDRPGSVQSQIRVGHIGVTRKDPDYFGASVLSQIFGGSFGSRLNKAIRIDKGLTYGAGGGFSTSRFAGTFRIQTFTKTPTTAETLKVILHEIDRIKASPPEGDEVTIARSYIVGSFAGDRETPSATVNDLWLIEYAGLPEDYLTRYLSGVSDSTAEKILGVAARQIHEDKLTIVVVGEVEKIKADLEKIAPVTVVPATAETPKPATEGQAPPGS